MAKFRTQVNSIKELPQAATKLLESLGDNKLIAFYGKMGAGKTTFIKAICEALGVLEIVNSPTFSIINQYETGQGELVNHFDFYRLETYQEALDIGIFDYWDSGDLCLMEWPEKVEKLLPEECVYLEIAEEELSGSRIISWELDK
jgi:tRNA threonylcarbamoyladenosine biosynthesis protein TsaE